MAGLSEPATSITGQSTFEKLAPVKSGKPPYNASARSGPRFSQTCRNLSADRHSKAYLPKTPRPKHSIAALSSPLRKATSARANAPPPSFAMCEGLTGEIKKQSNHLLDLWRYRDVHRHNRRLNQNETAASVRFLHRQEQRDQCAP